MYDGLGLYEPAADKASTDIGGGVGHGIHGQIIEQWPILNFISTMFRLMGVILRDEQLIGGNRDRNHGTSGLVGNFIRL